jgi:transglutaminase-like putative cysteine protease
MDNRVSIDKAKSVLLLTAALVMIVTWGVGATGWTKGINIITFVGLGAIIISLMLARSILPGLVAHLFSAIIGIGWSFWVTSRLLPANYTWIERWQNLVMRLNIWYERAVEGGTSYDNLMFIFQMGVIIWVMAYLTIWFLFRSGKVWPAIVPGGLVLLINLYYAPNDIGFWFIAYILVALLLVIRFNLFNQERQWRSEGVFFRPDIGFDFLRDGFIFSALVIAFAWLTPPVVDAKTLGLFDEFEGSWRDMQGEWNRLFADLNYRERRAFDSFGSSLKLGGPRRLTNEPVMDVQVQGVGRYWRAVVYDYYSGDGWLTQDEGRATFGPDAPLSLPQFEAREPVTQTFTFYRDNATVLYAMSSPVFIDRSARVTFNSLSYAEVAETEFPNWATGGEPWVEDISYIRSNATVDQGESYQVISMASNATVNQLQTAGDDYPSWVTKRYLQLPPTITGRTLELAKEITAPFDNNFDKARAIERYLRAELKYNESLPTPPSGIDKVDYILFTAKEAYCDYYATSMIVMLRSLGIPARLAAGFARGTYNSERTAYHVLNKDAHSWVEVYFPKYGWIEFEPTSAQPNIIRPTSSDDDNQFASPALPPENRPGLEDMPPGGFEDLPFDEGLYGGSLPIVFTLPFIGTQIVLPRGAVNGGLMVMGTAVAAALIVGGLWWRKQNQVVPGESIFSLYPRMVRFAGWMGIPYHFWQTPYEYAATVQRILPTYQREVESITTEYVYQTFRNKNGVARTNSREYPGQTYQNDLAWGRLRPAMLQAAIKRRLPKWLGKISRRPRY